MPGILIIGIISFFIFYIAILLLFIKCEIIDKDFCIFFNIIAPTLISFFLSVIIMGILGLTCNTTKIPTSQINAAYDLVATVNNDCYGGYSYLHYFAIDNDSKYFYSIIEDNAVKQFVISCDKCEIRYIGADSTPMVYIYEDKYKSNYTQWLFGAPKTESKVFYIQEDTIDTIISDNIIIK